jgi:mannosyltransferase
MTQRPNGPIPKPILLLALVMIISLGAALRIIKLGSESLWLDEATSIYMAQESLPEIVQEVSKDVHPPLFYFVLHYWMKVFGDSEFALRFLAVIFGVAAIPLVFILASRLFDQVTGLISALLLAASHFNIEYSQEARMYSMLVLLALGSFWFFLKLLRKEAGIGSLVGYILCTSLLTYTQVYSVFIIAAENLFLLLLFFSSREIVRRTFWRWLASQAAVFLLFLPWLFVLKRQIAEHKSFWIRPPTLFELRYAFLQIAGSHELFFLLIPLAALPVGWALLEKFSKTHEPGANVDSKQTEIPLSTNERVWFLFIWLACSTFLPFLGSFFVTPFFLAKYTICASIAFIILAARGIRMLPWPSAQILLVVIFIVLAQSDLRGYWNYRRKDKWREAVAFFNQKAQANDLVVFTEPAGHYPFDYYTSHRDIVERPLPLYNHEFDANTVRAVLKPVVSDHDRVWIVMSHQIDLCALVPKQMAEWYKVREHQTEPGVELYLFQKKK